MPEENYKNREIDKMVETLTEKLEEHHQDVMLELAEIKTDGKETKAQAQLTNGRVTKLETELKDYSEVKKAVIENSYWKKYVIVASSIVGTIIIAYAGLYISNITKQKRELNDLQYDVRLIKDKLQANDIIFE